MNLRALFKASIVILVFGPASVLGFIQPSMAETSGQVCLPCAGDCSRCGGEHTIWVDQVNGSDSHSGLAESEALQTISAGAAIVRGGDVMIVRPGTYYETPVFRDLDSSEEAPVWILSESPGAAVISGLWPEAEQGTAPWTNIGQDIYEAPHGDAFMGDVAGRFLFRYKSLADLEATSVLDIQKPDYGFAYEGDRIYLRLPNGADPTGMPIRLTDQFSQPIVTIENSPYVILDGFAVTGAGGTEAIHVDPASDHVTLRNLVITHSRLGARLPDDSLFEWSDYSYPGFYNFVDDLIDLNEGRTDEGNNYAIYDLVKKYFSKNGNAWLEGGLAESFDRPSSNAEFRYIYTHEIFDGQRFGAFISSSSHHNVCNYAYDDCIEFEYWSPTHPSTNLEVHDSLLMNAMGSAISHQDASGNMQGPQYVYRNVIYNTDYKHAHPAFLIKNRSLTASDQIFYYQNLMQNWQGTNKGWGKTNWLFWDNKKGTPEHLTFRNNILLFDQLTDKNNQEKPDSDYNILVNAQDSQNVRGQDGKYLGSSLAALKFKNPTGLDFALEPDSPAIGAGEALPKDWPDSRPTVDRPDIGPFEFGEDPGPDWPRPRTLTFTTSKPDRWR